MGGTICGSDLLDGQNGVAYQGNDDEVEDKLTWHLLHFVLGSERGDSHRTGRADLRRAVRRG